MSIRKPCVCLSSLLVIACSHRAVIATHRLWLAAAPDAAESLMQTRDFSFSESKSEEEQTAASGISEEELISWDRIQWHIPDPEYGRDEADRRLEAAIQANDKAVSTYIRRVLDRIDSIRRPEKLHLTLEDALHRALENSYAIETQRYNPAIETTQLVEARAAFDAVFFGSAIKNKIDRPSASQLSSSDIDFFDSTVGVRKVLSSGATVSAAWGLQRQKIALAFQQINPEYFSDLALEMRQPLLRGFGLDYNRSLIRIARNDRRISRLAFERQVRDTLRQTEESYWRLVQARRNLAVTARLLADFEGIYESLEARQHFDITPVQLSATRANLEQARAQFIQVRSELLAAEDRLIAAMNDPAINLGDHPEIVPDDFPQRRRIVVDRLAEAQTALDNRPEIHEQELRVANAEIAVGRAKNEELPKFDLTFRYTVDGLAGTADRAFDKMTGHNFVEYFVGVELEIPIGNRGPRARHQRARLLHSQAASALKKAFEEVILDVNLSARALSTSYDQLSPSFQAAEAREREVDSIVARAERKDINTLNTELGARQSLANARRAIVASLVEYNIAIIDLERSRGTLLRYNNVVIPDPEK